jgi:hypothetical protein
MLLFQKRFHEGLITGAITLTFRAWQKPLVKPGGRYRCHPIGVLEVDAIARVPVSSITDDDAKQAGFADRDHLVSYLAEVAPDIAALPTRAEVFRVQLHHGGDGDRVPEALQAEVTDEDRAAIAARLRKLDAASASGPWTARTLALIARRPRTAASKLALALGRETAPFKADVVKLKKLGLTQSFEVGYELSPRGQAYLRGARRRSSRSNAPKKPVG